VRVPEDVFFVKRVLVTGAAGFTARYLAEMLPDLGCELHGLVYDHGRDPISGYAELYEADLCDPAAVSRIVEEVRPELVVHLAAIAFVAHADIDQMYRVNVVGTRHLLEALSKLSSKPESILLASSANIYGNLREGTLTEGMSPVPANDYGVTKVAMEYVASLYRSKLPLITVRPFNYTGRGQSTDFIIPKLVDHARRRARVIELGNLDVARDFSDVRVVVDAYARLLQSQAAIGGTFNVCSGKPVALREVLELVQRLSGHDFEVRLNPAFVRANEVRILAGSPAQVEGVIGPLRAISLEETLRWMLEA